MIRLTIDSDRQFFNPFMFRVNVYHNSFKCFKVSPQQQFRISPVMIVEIYIDYPYTMLTVSGNLPGDLYLHALFKTGLTYTKLGSEVTEPVLVHDHNLFD
jgi:hypothetical protein